MSKVTYIFGAGASRHALPIVSEIPSRLAHFRNLYHDNRTGDMFQLSGPYKRTEIEDKFIKLCDEILDLLKTKQHASIDTYAKRLRLSIPREGKKVEKQYYGLKAILSSFFICEQLRNAPDYRYDSFFASILGNNHNDFPDSVRVLTWNYDFQFEKSYSLYSGQSKLSEIQGMLRVYQSGNSPRNTDSFGIYKLNGTTNFIKRESGKGPEVKYIYDDLLLPEYNHLMQRFTQLFDLVTESSLKCSSSLSFAWEADWSNETALFLSQAEAAVIDTETLVVIGYSFPFFNRNVDRRLIKSMGNKLSKVYIQDPRFDEVVSSFKSVLPKNEKWGDLSGLKYEKVDPDSPFFLPPEL